MLGFIFSIVFMLLGIAQLIGDEAPTWAIYASFGLSALWTLSYRLFMIFEKLKEIQEGIYADFAIRCGLVPDKKKEEEE